ncbi:MAG: 7-cyano-7-deazaguanine synthase QueC [Alphaproteobacteria bacterium]|nr:7-cyano-7-deazaguanine synthase QueC [Alphaproteobacteria bacterium]
MNGKALVLFSGGQDSTVALAWALDRFEGVETLGFDYGQRHKVELDCRPVILERLRREFSPWAERLGADHRLDVSVLKEIGGSALTDAMAIAQGEKGLPNTFVPGRNILFFTLAAAVAYRREAKFLVGGMCETDYSGYPDCRDDTLKALQATLNLGMETRLVIETPLMWIDKAKTWELAERLGGRALIDLIVEETHSCYEGNRERRHEWGYGCGVCPACRLRASGWERYRASHP